MAVDEELVHRIRALLADEDDVEERRMFGGLAFLLGGSMAVAASGAGGLMVRVEPQEEDALLAEPGVGPMVMRDRPATGWLRVTDEAVADDDALERWVRRGVARTRAI